MLLLCVGCYALDTSELPPCGQQADCADTHVCSGGACVLPHPDEVACGNGRVEFDEVCDDGDRGLGACKVDCSERCGDALYLNGDGNVYVHDNVQVAHHGLVIGTPRTLQVWFYPDLPENGPVAWTLMAKQSGESGNSLRIDLDRSASSGAVQAALLIDGQKLVSMELPRPAWYHMAFVLTRSGDDLVVTPYLNGQTQVSGRAGIPFSEIQDGDFIVGAAGKKTEGAPRAFIGFIANLSFTNRAVYTEDFLPPYPFGWHGHPWIGEEGYTQAYWTLENGVGGVHAPSGNRVYWGPSSLWYPLWLDDGFELAPADLRCIPGAQCGDGLKAPYESCDDGNNFDSDGCSASCRVE